MFGTEIITARNVNEAFRAGLDFMNSDVNIVTEESRNGKVFVHEGPVITETKFPMERILFNPARHANPFFHLMESLWMLGGKNDLKWLTQFNKQMKFYSDDGGITQPAAYGHRWREHFGYDQIPVIIRELRTNPQTRRCVLAMWDGGTDDEAFPGDLKMAVKGSADVPCNTQCFFTLRNGELHMAVTCRSNDLLWGAHGANAVHFSVLQEYIAASVGVKVGTMTQMSWNYHLYDGVLKHPIPDIQNFHQDPYANGTARATPMFEWETMTTFDEELDTFLNWAKPFETTPSSDKRASPPYFKHDFLQEVAVPMVRCWDSWKRADVVLAIQQSYNIGPLDFVNDAICDWQLAARGWLQRNYDKLHNERNGVTEISV